MIALTTPSPVYWLLDVIQTIGILGILGSFWLLILSGPRRRGPRPVKLQITADAAHFLRRGRDERGASRIETIAAWAALVGLAALAWTFIGYGLWAVSH